MRDRATGQTILVTRNRAGGPANDHSGLPAISADGTVVGYQSYASDLVAGTENAIQRAYSTVLSYPFAKGWAPIDARAARGPTYSPVHMGDGPLARATGPLHDASEPHSASGSPWGLLL